MTTDRDLLARIKEERKLIDEAQTDNSLDYVPSEMVAGVLLLKSNNDSADAAWKVLRAVVEREDFVSYNPNPDQSEKYFRSGYNQALADVRQAIEKELG